MTRSETNVRLDVDQCQRSVFVASPPPPKFSMVVDLKCRYLAERRGSMSVIEGSLPGFK